MRPHYILIGQINIIVIEIDVQVLQKGDERDGKKEKEAANPKVTIPGFTDRLLWQEHICISGWYGNYIRST